MRGRYVSSTQKIAGIFTVLLIALSVTGYAYSHWQEELHITGKVKTGKWKACVKIMKELDGAYTDPETGEHLSEPTDIIAIAADFPTKFKLTIYVKNCEATKLKNVVVTDTIKNNMAPRTWTTKEEGTVEWVNYGSGHKSWDGIHFGFNELTWTIGTLNPGKEAWLEIWIETLQNPSDKYEPTSGDEGDGQDIEINEGATVTAKSTFSNLSATTDGITLTIIDDDTPENGIGKIDSPELPYLTPWAKDRYP